MQGLSAGVLGSALLVLYPLAALAQGAGAGAASSQSAVGASGPAAQENPVPGVAGTPAVPSGPSPGEPGFATNLMSRSTLLGDLYGARTFLGRYGISLGLTDTEEVVGTLSGGINRGAAYEGLTEMSLGVDTQKAFGWAGGTFNVSAFQIHGRAPTLNDVGSLEVVSNIEALRATRLWELWYQQAVLDGRVDVKLGQQSLDQEFMVSQYGGLFINSAFGWPVLPAVDQYAGGPAYPLSSLGVRLRAQATGAITVLGGVFDDNPAGGPFSQDLQTRGAEQSGTAFNLGTGALVFAEVQYALNQPATGDMVQPGAATSGLPGVYKLGGWYDSGRFPDPSEMMQAGQSVQGLPLATAASGTGGLRRHNYSVYATADQMVWRPDPQGAQALGVFVRAMGAPGDRNLVSASVDGGLVLKAPLPGRDSDSVGLGFGYARIGRSAVLADEEAQLAGSTSPVRSAESFIELTYQYQVAPWWQVQPDLQYVVSPGGNVADPDGSGHRVGNAAVVALRTSVTF